MPLGRVMSRQRLWMLQDLRVHHVHRMARREGQDLINCCAQQGLRGHIIPI